ncbi:hypothetical protein FOA52_012192 [Chlamydomonas sp. UWO 241]|nr:hypothetical protein FOA52_012192 [Chlamydomonas sp. UWO 241]
MLLAMQRNQNVGVLLANLKMPPAQVVDAVRTLVTTGQAGGLTQEQINSIARSLATPDERKTLSKYTGAVGELSEAEQMLIGLTELPALEERLACAKLVASFKERVGGVCAAGDTLKGACAEVCGNPLLHLILKIALIIGNFLNAGAPQGSAIGFQLDTLLKLKDVRATNNKAVTLMHFIARELQAKHPGADCLKEQLELAPQAARLNLATVREELRDLKTALRQMGKVLDAPAEATGDAPEFRQFLGSFYADATAGAAAAEAGLDEADKKAGRGRQ